MRTELKEPEYTKTELAAKKIAAGISLGKVLRDAEEEKMSAGQTLAKYRQESIDALRSLAQLITDDGQRRLSDIQDSDLHALAVATEATGRGARNYLRLKQAFEG